MTEDRRARKQNQIMNPLGLIPAGGDWSGQSVFQFKRACDIRVIRRKPQSIQQSASGLWVPTQQEWEVVPQTTHTDNRWCIAQWREPSYTEAQWVDRFGFLLAYPENGWWWMFLPLNYLPDEEWTQWWVKTMMEQKSRSIQESANMTREHFDKQKADSDRQIVELARDNFVNHVPGAKGGVVSYPRTRFDR